jgi:ketosteroid isomerase-like protein
VADESAVRDMLAREEIRQLPYRYAAAFEARDVDAMANLFMPHSLFGDYGEGPEGLRRLMADNLEGTVFAVVLVANHLIDLEDENHARGQVWAHCFAQTRHEGFVEQLITYEDRYERHHERWRFLHRKHRLWYGVLHHPSPVTQQPAEWPRNQTGVGDVLLSNSVFADWWSNRERQ